MKRKAQSASTGCAVLEERRARVRLLHDWYTLGFRGITSRTSAPLMGERQKGRGFVRMQKFADAAGLPHCREDHREGREDHRGRWGGRIEGSKEGWVKPLSVTSCLL